MGDRLWNALLNKQYSRDELIRAVKEGNVKSRLLQLLDYNPYLAKTLVNYPLSTSTIICFFSSHYDPSDKELMIELYDFLDVLCSNHLNGDIILLFLTCGYYIFTDYVVDRFVDGNTDTLFRLLNIVAYDKTILRFLYIVILDVLVKLFLSNTMSFEQVLAAVYLTPYSDTIRHVLTVALCNEGDVKCEKIVLQVFSALVVSEDRLRDIVKKYYECGVTCEEMFDLVSSFYRVPMQDTKSILHSDLEKRLIRVVVVESPKSLSEYDISKLTPQAIKLLTHFTEIMPTEV